VLFPEIKLFCHPHHADRVGITQTNEIDAAFL
jgi:hypothetical protein